MQTEKTNIVILVCLMLVCLIIYHKIKYRNMVYTKSDIDNEYYMVRGYADRKNAANLLASLKARLWKVIHHAQTKTIQDKQYESYKLYVDRLQKRFKGAIIMESPENSIYTSYCVNKGEEIVFCIRSKSIVNALKSNNIHAINLIMYVALHEISHIACPEKDHTPLFKKIFHFLCTMAIEIGMYSKIDFAHNPKEYCGITIYESII